MSPENDTRLVDPRSGFDRRTKIYHSLRPSLPLPPPDQPLSVTEYAISLQRSSAGHVSTKAFAVSAYSSECLTYSEFLRRTRSLALSLHERYSLSRNDVAFVIAPASFHIPVLYFSLMQLGVVVCPANPLGSISEVSHQVEVSKPVIAFATSQTVHKLPSSIPRGTILLDSQEFETLLNCSNSKSELPTGVGVKQSDLSAILFSSGTTGRIKGVMLSHRNIISLIEGYQHSSIVRRIESDTLNTVSLFTLPLFHVFGFFMMILAISLGDTIVLMEKFDFETMLNAIERHRVTNIPVSPPLMVAMVKSDLTEKYDLSSLRQVGCGGAPLSKEVSEKFKQKFPKVEIVQGYGMTETAGSATRTIGPEETARFGTVGRLAENLEAKIVDPVTGAALPPGQKGELWIRGPVIMKGYAGDDKATAEAFDSEGWLKTGDLCYFDSEGFLYIVDRLKELIKYKAYQVPPAELEDILHSHPEVADAAVIPFPDEEAGQIPMAFVVRKPGSNLSEAQLITFVANQVAPYKKIRRVSFISAIPKNPSGKILKRELINQAVSTNLSRL